MCSSGVKECGACGSPDPEFACSRCKAARFCGPECFRKAWPAHKAICGARAEKEKERPHPWPSPFSCVRAQSEGLVQTGRTGRIAFIDFWPGFEDNTDLWFCQDWFKRNLPGVEIVDASASPDVIMFSMFGKRYISLLQSGSSAKLVFFTGENLRPPVGRVPLCVSFDHLEGVPQSIHARIPLWVFNMEVHEVLTMHAARLSGKVDESVWKRDFCCWVASNATMYRAEFRTRFVKTLSARYKQVDCGGEVLNNIGGKVKDKMTFLRGYRFNICFENASHPGYCTEKILHAFAAGCVPIYWGDPNACPTSDRASMSDFNPRAFISAHDFESPELLLQHIARVDNAPSKYRPLNKSKDLTRISTLKLHPNVDSRCYSFFGYWKDLLVEIKTKATNWCS